MDQDFSEFMAARWNALYRTAYLLTGEPHQAEDLLQEALAKTCVKWNTIRDKGAADGYVRRILAHDAIKGWRRRERELLGDPPSDVGTDDGLARHEIHLDLWQAIQELPPRMRAVLVLRYYEDLTETATADALGISVGAVKSQAHAATRRLSHLLDEPTATAQMGNS